MFTGIIREVGTLLIRREAGDTYLRIACQRAPETIETGASIACNGICLTVMEAGTDQGRHWFEVAASAETKDKTTLGAWRPGQRINLEPALRLGDELGGHIVSGHVDGAAGVLDTSPEGDSVRFRFAAPEAFERYISPKGSVALDGVSLTVNEVDGATFGVNIIPHTLQRTTFRTLGAGGRVNFEVDTIARYVARLLGKE